MPHEPTSELRTDPDPGPDEGLPIGDVRLEVIGIAPANATGWRSGMLRTMSVLAAIALHGLVMAALLRQAPTDVGIGGTVLDAIGVEVVSAEALERQAAAAGAASIAAAPAPDVVEARVPPPAEPASEPEPQVASAPPPAVSDPSPVAAEEVAELPVAPERHPRRDAAVLEPDDRPSPEPPKEAQRQTAEAPRKEEVPRAAEPAAPSSAAAPSNPALPVPAIVAGARPGELQVHARAVQAAMLRAVPKGVGRTGTVTVRFRLDADGNLESSEVLKSSGSRQLDEAALAALNLASFPRPPAGATPRQRTFDAPYRFQ